MKLSENKSAGKYFGKVWEELTRLRKDIGGFMLVHEKKEVYYDDNFPAIAGFNSEPSYDELASWPEKTADSGEEFEVVLIADSTKEKAGFVCKIGDEKHSEGDSSSIISQEELIECLKNDRKLNMVMLLRFEDSETIQSLEESIYCALSVITHNLGPDQHIAKRNDNEYWIAMPAVDDPVKYAKELQQKVSESALTDEFGFVLKEKNDVQFFVGICMAENNTASEMMHAAVLALFRAVGEGSGSVEVVSGTAQSMDYAEYKKLENFAKLLEENLFTYHFQPIISARSGKVIAYEALMRTDKEIGLNPLQILELAERFDRLYDIEHATLFNTLEYLSKNQSEFDNKKLFINSIPSYPLTEKDFSELKSRYGELLEKVVIEMTEQTEIEDNKLEYICDRIRGIKSKLAIDDYGTGYSNTSKLISFNPDYVKLDRSLIEDIDSNPKKQAIITSLIDFIHSNNGLVLGEGVETREELETLMDLGCDLFQGYFISRPKPVLVKEISAEVKAEIERINLETTAVIKKVRQANSGDRIELKKLIEDNVTDIFIGGGEYFFIGAPDQLAKVTIKIKENVKCDINFKNVCLQPESGRPSIIIGNGSVVRLNVEGENLIKKFGIHVPERASLYIGGKGNLSVLVENRDCFAIGTNSKNAAGYITIDLKGKLTINTNGEYCVGIGGGKTGGPIEIKSGEVILGGSGGQCLGIGSIYGEAVLKFSFCKISVKYASAKSCGVGSIEGSAKLTLNDMCFESEGSGNSFCGIGLLDGDYAVIEAENVGININARAKRVVNIGSYNAECSCRIKNSTVNLYAEGETTVGIGDSKGRGIVELVDTGLDIKFMSGNAFACGTMDCDALYTRGKQTIVLNE